MNLVIYFKDLFESITENRKNVPSWFLIKNDVDLLHECRLRKLTLVIYV